MPRKPSTKKAMIEYLTNHFRYDTLNSWNASTSYARNIKVHKLGLARETESAAFDMLEVREAFYEFNHILRQFDERWNHQYQIWSNGRSGGYLVLGQGGTRPSQHKSVCRECGQRNYQSVPDGMKVGQCGRCGAMARVNATFKPDVYVQPGLSLDMHEEFDTWSIDDLRSRVNLVWDFDQTCQRAVDAFIRFCKTHVAKEKTIMVPKQIRVAERKKTNAT